MKQVIRVRLEASSSCLVPGMDWQAQEHQLDRSRYRRLAGRMPEARPAFQRRRCSFLPYIYFIIIDLIVCAL